jgi:hypothetical protein
MRISEKFEKAQTNQRLQTNSSAWVEPAAPGNAVGRCASPGRAGGFVAKTLGVVFIACSLMLLSAPSATAKSFSVTIKVALNQESRDRVIAETKPLAVALCESGIENQYGMRKGSPVRVLDGRGAIVGVGRITKVNVIYIGPSVQNRPLWTCNYATKIKVERTTFYTVYVQNVKGPEYTYQELKDRRFRLDLIL